MEVESRRATTESAIAVDLGQAVIGGDGDESTPVYDLGRKSVGACRISLETVRPVTLTISYGPLPDLLEWRAHIEVSECGLTTANVPGPQHALRYFAIAIAGSSPEVTLRRFEMDPSYLTDVPIGALVFDDDELSQIWRCAVRTNQLCVVPGRSTLDAVQRHAPNDPERFAVWNKPPARLIVDGPRRDMEAWIGDVRVQALALYYSHGAYNVVEETLRHFANLQSPSGRIPASSASLQQFATYVCWWIISLYEHYLHSGKLGFVEEMRDHLVRAADWVLNRVTNDGAFVGDRDWTWTIARLPATPASQAVFAWCSESGGLLASALGMGELSDRWKEAHHRAVAYYVRLTADRGTTGVITEGLQIVADQLPVFQDSNSLPIVFGLESEEPASRILAYLRQHMWTECGSVCTDSVLSGTEIREECTHYDIFPVGREELGRKLPALTWAHTRKVWPFANAYEVQARLMTGDVDGAIELTRLCWSTFIRHPPGTCWELVDPDAERFPRRKFLLDGAGDTYNSACHGWSGWISYVLAAHLAGIRPIEPGFVKTLVNPLPSTLRSTIARVPTPSGPISMTIDRVDDGWLLHLDSPRGIRIVFDLSPLRADGSEVRITGTYDE